MAGEREPENWYYCALCDDHHETFRSLRDLSNSSADLPMAPHTYPVRWLNEMSDHSSVDLDAKDLFLK